MPRLKKFKTQKEKKISTKNLFVAFGIIIGLLSVGYVYKSYAIYKMQKEFDVIKTQIGSYTMGDVRVAVMVDGKEASEFPSYETNYKVEKIECTNGVVGQWDTKNWRLVVDDMSATSTKCTIHFNSKETNSETPIAYSKEELLAINEEIKNMAYEQMKTQLLNDTYPIGSIYMSTTEDTIEKVQSKFGGTWVKYSEGRTLIGVGTTTDSNNESKTFAVNETGGEYNHTLTTAEIPSHYHTERLNFSLGVRQLGYGDNCGMDVAGSIKAFDWDAFGTQFTKGSCPGDASRLTTAAAGGSGSHNNISPYTAVYMYKRTA